MDAKTARETIIKPKLTAVFGAALTTSLLTAAIGAGIGGNTEPEKLALMVKSVLGDPKVLGMWGKAQVEKQMKEWLALVT
jgi:hypothetical protein